ncbi:glycosyltransferase family protein [bacterium]|nr:glycosyltransferase family protein [bacterium]
MQIAAIIQARVGSRRLPGKVLKRLSGHSVLWHVVQRVSRALTVDEIIVATSNMPQDDHIVEECRRIGVPVFRGSENDVLARFYYASQQISSDYICRITADNPLVEPGFIDMASARLDVSGEDYLAVSGCPVGTGVELFSKEFLSYAHENAVDPYDREHVTPFMKMPGGSFSSGCIVLPPALTYPDLRLTMDTQEDYDYFTILYNCLYTERTIISFHDVMHLIREKRDVLYRKMDQAAKPVESGAFK